VIVPNVNLPKVRGLEDIGVMKDIRVRRQHANSKSTGTAREIQQVGQGWILSIEGMEELTRGVVYFVNKVNADKSSPFDYVHDYWGNRIQWRQLQAVLLESISGMCPKC
jgi:hypothetical protein